MATSKSKSSIPQGKILQLPSDEAVKWVKNMLDTSATFKLIYDYFIKKGYTFYPERAKVFVNIARSGEDEVVPSVLGILPSFVPTTSADDSHPAVGISIHHSGYAIATSVNVSHRPFGVTEFTLHEVEPKTKKVVTSTLSTEEIGRESVNELAKRMHTPFVPKKGAEVSKEERKKINSFSAIDPGEQGLLINSVVQQLLADNYSRSLFPPQYARALNTQTPTFQKFAFVTRERFQGTVLGVTLSSSTSTSSNICTSTSTSTIEI
ncbi:hypothetical protein ACFS7Z_21005 [Pontibacter toksunensis]|uniref:RGS domain-containing protein n=1 Tax=Pontibacter toksunensis TaxID=1332631 RepID=A0ABW6BZN3_9BACT